MDESMTIDEILISQQWAMFAPTTANDLLWDYPELQKVEPFKVLAIQPQKMLFVYFYGCKMSRAMDLIEDKERIRYALRMAWKDKVPQDIQRKYIDGKWGDDVQAAIDAMRAYEPEPRIVMKLMCLRMMGRLKRIMDKKEPSELKEVKDYLSAMSSAMALMKDLQPFMEHNAFGITTKTNKNDLLDRPGAMMEFLHNNDN
jgi:hypothetical protein